MPGNRVKSGDDEWNKDRGQNQQNEHQDSDEAGHGSLTLCAGRISRSSVIPTARRPRCRTPERPPKRDYKSLTVIQSRAGRCRSCWRTSEVTDVMASITVRSQGGEHARPTMARDRQSCWASMAPVHVVVPREVALRSNCGVGRVLVPGWPPIVGLKPFAPRCPAVGVGV